MEVKKTVAGNPLKRNPEKLREKQKSWRRNLISMILVLALFFLGIAGSVLVSAETEENNIQTINVPIENQTYISYNEHSTSYTTLCKYQLPELPEGAVIVNAKYDIRLWNHWGDLDEFKVFEVLSDWIPNDESQPVPDLAEVPLVSSFPSQMGDVCSFGVTGLVQEWYEGKENFGLAATGDMIVASFEDLQIEYYVDDYAPVIGEFVPDPDMLSTIAEKESEAQAQISTFATSKRLAINQSPQETNFWCGYAAMKSLLDFKGKKFSQTEIAILTYSMDKSCPWYISNGNSKSQFSVAVNLTNWTKFTYIPFSYGAAGATPITASDMKTRVTSTINTNNGCMACGTSKKSSSHASHLPGYPTNSDITHWVAIDGYKDSGNSIWIVDPAKSTKVSWSGNISAYYSIPSSKLAAFAQTRGLIW